jgi:(+)-abscisic acid 8'-hydroxylase
LLGVLLGATDQKLTDQLTDSQIADNLIGVIFAAHDTTASVLTWVLKYLHDNGNLLDAVTVNIIFLSSSFDFYSFFPCSGFFN